MSSKQLLRLSDGLQKKLANGKAGEFGNFISMPCLTFRT